MNHSLTKLIRIAILYKIFVFLIILLLDSLFEDFDQSTQLLLDYEHLTFFQKAIFDLFKGQLRWDTLFFVEIANKGYQNDKNHAFFPLFPILLNICSKPFQLFIQNKVISIVLAGYILNSMIYFELIKILFK
jgi:phosphatidylinositol glycan class V